MIILLSPAKSLDETPTHISDVSEIAFPKETTAISKSLKKLSAKNIGNLMDISEKLALENYLRYQHFDTQNYTLENSKQAVLLFKGAAYLALEADILNKEELDFAQEHLRMLSGLYGILKPYDLIHPYRLEMGTKIAIKNHSNLYQYWGNKITEKINADIADVEGDTIVNLASFEYFKAVNVRKLDGDLINVYFKEERDGVYKTIAFNAKKARGLMTKFIIQNKIIEPEGLKAFIGMDYLYDPNLSDGNEWVFSKEG